MLIDIKAHAAAGDMAIATYLTRTIYIVRYLQGPKGRQGRDGHPGFKGAKVNHYSTHVSGIHKQILTFICRVNHLLLRNAQF